MGEVLTSTKGRVLLVEMRNDTALNAYDREMVEHLRRTWRRFDDDPELSVAVLTGSGTTSFSTGFDLKDTEAAGIISPSLDDGRVRLTARQLGVEKPVVVAVNGHCCAGGWHFVNDADIVLASENASFFDTHVDVGLVNSVEAVGLLTKLPANEVLRMVLTGRRYRIDARRAYELGLVTEVTAPGDLVARAIEIASDVAAHPLDVLMRSSQVIWEVLRAQRSGAERLGLELLMRTVAEKRLSALQASAESLKNSAEANDGPKPGR